MRSKPLTVKGYKINKAWLMFSYLTYIRMKDIEYIEGLNTLQH